MNELSTFPVIFFCQIILKIIYLLDPDEILHTISLLSWKFFNLISNDVGLMRKFKLQLNKVQLEGLIFEETAPLRLYRVISLVSLDISRLPVGLTTTFENVETLILYGCTFNSVPAFQSLLQSCGRLKVLELDEPKMQIPTTVPMETGNYDLAPPIVVEKFRFVLPIYAFSTEIEDHKEPWELIKLFGAVAITFKAIDLQFGVYKFTDYAKIEEMLAYFEQNYAKSWKKLLVYNEYSGPTYRQVIKHLCKLTNLRLDSLELTTSYDDSDDIAMLEQLLQRQSSVTDFRLHEESYEKHFSIGGNCLLDLVPRDPHTFNRIIQHTTQLESVEFIVVEHDLFTFSVPTTMRQLKFRGRYESFDLRLLPSLGALTRLETLDMHNAHLRAGDLQEIFKSMGGLKRLTITSSDCQLPPELFSGKSRDHTIGSLGKLEFLKLGRSSIDDQVLMAISAVGLKEFCWYKYNEEVWQRVSQNFAIKG
jgi:hypothetical protein